MKYKIEKNTVDEMKIINQIAGVYSAIGQNKKAADIYYQLLKYVQKHQQEAVISSGMLPMVLMKSLKLELKSDIILCFLLDCKH